MDWVKNEKFNWKVKLAEIGGVTKNLVNSDQNFIKRTNFENEHILAQYRDLVCSKIDTIQIITQNKSVKGNKGSKLPGARKFPCFSENLSNLAIIH